VFRLFLEASDKAADKGGAILEFTFPNHDDIPARLLQLARICPIALDVSGQFFHPELRACFRQRCVSASFVPVPETTMDEDNRMESRQHNVRLPREILAAKGEAKTVLMKQRPNETFRFGVAVANTAHVPTAVLGSEFVHLELPLSHQET